MKETVKLTLQVTAVVLACVSVLALLVYTFWAYFGLSLSVSIQRSFVQYAFPQEEYREISAYTTEEKGTYLGKTEKGNPLATSVYQLEGLDSQEYLYYYHSTDKRLAIREGVEEPVFRYAMKALRYASAPQKVYPLQDGEDFPELFRNGTLDQADEDDPERFLYQVPVYLDFALPCNLSYHCTLALERGETDRYFILYTLTDQSTEEATSEKTYIFEITSHLPADFWE